MDKMKGWILFQIVKGDERTKARQDDRQGLKCVQYVGSGTIQWWESGVQESRIWKTDELHHRKDEIFGSLNGIRRSRVDSAANR